MSFRPGERQHVELASKHLEGAELSSTKIRSRLARSCTRLKRRL